MAQYKVNDTSLTAVANAIRERAGTEDQLTFPDGFVSAVEGIPDLLEQLITSTLVEYSNANITKFKAYAFTESRALRKVTLPNITEVTWFCFDGCTALEEFHGDKVKNLVYRSLSNTKLSTLTLPSVTKIEEQALANTPLSALILPGLTICVLNHSNVFPNTPIANGTGYIYVPRALVDSYKAATNWSNFASQIRAIEDYPEITGG